MRKYDYTSKWEKLLTPDIVFLLTQIHEFKGEQTLFIETNADLLTELVDVAKSQSTEASNKMEGIYTSNARSRLLTLLLVKIVTEKTVIQTLNLTSKDMNSNQGRKKGMVK